ncbi:hypothetical protein [Chitinophaga sp. CB10]|uniref:hypothetical protein n=1 Tax=Chitinophaga sp. CB10 TaxID=1891659 RepID=UPI0025BDD130|nr:hypothetical protein [Chitinophaga sp. CB10]
MDWDEVLDPFSQDFQQSMEEQLRIVHVQDGLVTAANDLVAAHFPAAATLSPRAQKNLQRVIISQSVQMANAIQEALQQREEE